MKRFLDLLRFLTAKRRGTLLIAGALALLTILFSLTPIHDNWEGIFYDLRCKLKPRPPVLPELVLLNVDDASITTVGQYPWPRSYYAKALERMKASGLDNLVFDFQFIDRSPPLLDEGGYERLAGSLAAGASLGRADLASVVLDSDAVLASAIAGFEGTVIPYSFSKISIRPILSEGELERRSDAIERFKGIASIPVPKGRERDFDALVDPSRADIQYPIPSIVAAAWHFGFVDSDPDRDGAFRRIQLVRAFEG
ncbi:MAG: CHASE2 domain-containing protein, partial [Spirochaetota bacterium]